MFQTMFDLPQRKNHKSNSALDIKMRIKKRESRRRIKAH